ncbi:hypothetical protein DFQ05_0592 [Winogradskyella wandonensis]|uniref:Lipocalin-like protein n=1 Tax=Winogradskyella wandonensis TaxID=1442586 RepID=A0A4R1KWM0_9FLAO|nr:hypothetical protein [Winogradskyella wandonensis]TCK69080.1 hypothetical protein DFQ05_0592 [Winogradskyella wandonensis]
MKKVLALFCVFVLCSAFQCDDEPLEGEFVTEDQAACVLATENTIEAALAFLGATEDNYTDICNTYKTVIEAQIAACGDDNGELQALIDELGDCTQEQNENDILGTWLLTAWIGEEPVDLNNDGTGSTNFLEEMDCYNNETLVFNDDGTGASISTSYADIEIFLDPDNSEEFDFTVDCILENETTQFTWTQDGNIITTTDVFGTFDWTLEGNTLSTTIPEGFTVINTEDATVNTIQDLTFVYTKQ